jgi:DeoR family transcriptional regulator, aga operon transcriptional repressor
MSHSIAKRHQQIMHRLHIQGYVNVTELSTEFDVSAVTIRKDLRILEARKLLFRSHGSASLQDPYIADKHVNEKEKICVEEKRRIALKALTLLQNRQSIILASGTTINEFARHINGVKGLTVLCASISAARELVLRDDIEVWQLGGLVRKNSASVIGPFSERMLEHFSCSKLFLGVDGIDLEFGLTTTNALEANLNQKMIKAAQKVIVLTDSSKFGRRGLSLICQLDNIDQIVTDPGISKNMKKRLEEKGIEIIIA